MTNGIRSGGIVGGKYEILSKPDVGGMGEVYQARHRFLGELRAIKVMRASSSRDPHLQERFLREARIASRLDHPNLVRLYDFTFNEDGTACMIFEWVKGLDLAKLLVELGRLPLDDALEIAEQSLSALAYLHGQGIVHRDISSDNLMVSKGPESDLHVKLIDVGIAKGIDSSVELTTEGLFVGKLRYAAPEVIDSKRKSTVPDPRSDLYSFGVVFYELLTGTGPVEGESESELIAGHLLNPPRPFSESDPDGRVPEELRRIALKALQKQPENRYQSAEEFASDLARVRSGIAAPSEPDSADLRSTIGLVLTDTAAPLDDSLEVDQERLDRLLGARPDGDEPKTITALGNARSEEEEEAWFERLRKAHLRRGSKSSKVASSVIKVLREHPRTALSAALGLLLAMVVVFSGVLSGKDAPTGGGSPPAVKAAGLETADVEPVASELETSETVGSDRQDEAYDEEPGVAAQKAAAEFTEGRAPAKPVRFKIILVSNNAQFSSALIGRLGDDLPVVFGSTLSRALATGGRGLVIQLDVTTHSISVEAYETSLPSCEVVATASVMIVPTGRSRYSRSIRRMAPRCADAVALAGSALATDLEPKLRALLNETR